MFVYFVPEKRFGCRRAGEGEEEGEKRRRKECEMCFLPWIYIFSVACSLVTWANQSRLRETQLRARVLCDGKRKSKGTKTRFDRYRGTKAEVARALWLRDSREILAWLLTDLPYATRFRGLFPDYPRMVLTRSLVLVKRRNNTVSRDRLLPLSRNKILLCTKDTDINIDNGYNGWETWVKNGVIFIFIKIWKLWNIAYRYLLSLVFLLHLGIFSRLGMLLFLYLCLLIFHSYSSSVNESCQRLFLVYTLWSFFYFIRRKQLCSTSILAIFFSLRQSK